MSERVVNLHVLLQHVPSDAFFSQLPALEEDDFSQVNNKPRRVFRSLGYLSPTATAGASWVR